MEHTFSKSNSGEKSNNENLVPLSFVKELIKVQETAMKSFFMTFVNETNKRFDNLNDENKKLNKRFDDLNHEVKGIITSLQRI